MGPDVLSFDASAAKDGTAWLSISWPNVDSELRETAVAIWGIDPNESGFKLDNLRFHSCEEYFHYAKFLKADPEFASQVLRILPSQERLKAASNKNVYLAWKRNQSTSPGWKQHAEMAIKSFSRHAKSALAWGLRAKFTQNRTLKRALLLTEDAILISPGSNNTLGHLLMELRADLGRLSELESSTVPLLRKKKLRRVRKLMGPYPTAKRNSSRRTAKG